MWAGEELAALAWEGEEWEEAPLDLGHAEKSPQT